MVDRGPTEVVHMSKLNSLKGRKGGTNNCVPDLSVEDGLSDSNTETPCACLAVGRQAPNGSPSPKTELTLTGTDLTTNLMDWLDNLGFTLAEQEGGPLPVSH